MYRILVVEDEDDIQKILENYLIDQGYAVTLAYDGVDGIAKFHNGEFDLVLLDVMMPKIDGFGVCELIRRESNVPIIMLTALDEEAYQIKGFDMNADDYVTKPFSIPILLRKIAAILRRTQREDELQVISYKTLSVDVKGHHVYICKAEKGEQIEVELTQKEFEMLYVLLINKGIVLTRQKLLNMVSFSFWKSSITCLPDLLSSAPVGSSARRSLGLFTMARAMATRCICPPES